MFIEIYDLVKNIYYICFIVKNFINLYNLSIIYCNTTQVSTCFFWNLYCYCEIK